MLGSLLISGSNIFVKDLETGQDSGWHLSVYGVDDDEIGGVSLITPQAVLQTMKLVKQNKPLSLAVPVDKNFPSFRQRSFRLYNIQSGQQDSPPGLKKFTL